MYLLYEQLFGTICSKPVMVQYATYTNVMWNLKPLRESVQTFCVLTFNFWYEKYVYIHWFWIFQISKNRIRRKLFFKASYITCPEAIFKDAYFFQVQSTRSVVCGAVLVWYCYGGINQSCWFILFSLAVTCVTAALPVVHRKKKLQHVLVIM